MAEMIKANIYLTYLDQILAGKKDIGSIDDVEIKKLLLLAKTMMATDLSVNSNMRENLRKQLMVQLTKEDKLSISQLLSNDEELDEDTLDYVAAGFAGQIGAQMDICPYCGARSQKLVEKCSFCGH